MRKHSNIHWIRNLDHKSLSDKLSIGHFISAYPGICLQAINQLTVATYQAIGVFFDHVIYYSYDHLI